MRWGNSGVWVNNGFWEFPSKTELLWPLVFHNGSFIGFLPFLVHFPYRCFLELPPKEKACTQILFLGSASRVSNTKTESEYEDFFFSLVITQHRQHFIISSLRTTLPSSLLLLCCCGKAMNFGVRINLEFKSCLCHSLAVWLVWPCSSYFASVNLSFPTCKTRVIVPTSRIIKRIHYIMYVSSSV